MTTLEIIKTFLKAKHKILFGYNEIVFLPIGKLQKGQIGYSVDKKNNSLVTGRKGDWRKEWLVIGVDGMLGDPIFVDTGSRFLAVLTAAHGEGKWEPIPIADSLSSFVEIISELKVLSENRESPDELEEYPISDKERKQFIQKVKKKNSKVVVEYWKNFLDG